MREPKQIGVREALESSTLLNDLSEDEKQALAGQCKVYHCPRSELIWGSGAVVGFFGLVGSGFVKMVKTNPGGVEMTLEIMGPGQVFGLLATIEGTGCPLSAYGLTDTTYLRIPKRAFLPIYESNQTLRDRLFRRTVVRMHQKLDFMALLSSGTAEQRLATIILVLSESYGVHGENSFRLSVPMTRQALGEMAGTTTETTIRVLSKWTQEGLISTDQQVISVLNEEAFKRRLPGAQL